MINKKKTIQNTNIGSKLNDLLMTKKIDSRNIKKYFNIKRKSHEIVRNVLLRNITQKKDFKALSTTVNDICGHYVLKKPKINVNIRKDINKLIHIRNNNELIKENSSKITFDYLDTLIKMNHSRNSMEGCVNSNEMKYIKNNKSACKLRFPTINCSRPNRITYSKSNLISKILSYE